jgi:antiviral helicase SKI2
VAKEQEVQANEAQKDWSIIDELDVSMPFAELVPNAATEFPFELDPFQKRAIKRIEEGNCVFVAAHTSAGKTVIAEYAVAKSLKNNMKCFFTAPVKALSNQKYREFKQKFQDGKLLF